MTANRTIGPFPAGMNNRAKDSALPEGSARNIVNADIDETGRARRRAGFTRIVSGLSLQQSFSCPLGVFYVDGQYLRRLNNDNTTTVLHSGISGPCCFHYENGVVYWSDGVFCKTITVAGVGNWGTYPPPSPLISPTSGTYGAGRYLAALSYVDGNGLESGASPLAQIDLPENSGIVFSNLPGAVRIYLSVANGTVLYHVADTSAPSYTVASGRYDTGNTLDLLHVSPPPPATIIRSYNGRVYVADGNGVVWYSEPFSPHHFRLGESYIPFPGPVTIMEPVTAGIYFATDRESWFYAGNPEDGFQVFNKFNYGGIKGTGQRNDDGTVCWQSQMGMVIGQPDGQCQNVQEKNVATDSAASGASIIMERNGLRQYIASLQQPRVSRLAAQSWISADIVRRGE
jgi:hypothetical protein